MERRRVLRALSVAVAGVSGCGSFEQSGERTPYDPPERTVGATESDDALGPTEDARADDQPDRRSPVLVSSTVDDQPCPSAGSNEAICYHDLEPETLAYLAPLTERLRPGAETQTFVAFNRHRDDLELALDERTVHRRTESGWETLPSSVASSRTATATVTAADRTPVIFTLSLERIAEASALSNGTYAVTVPSRFVGADEESFRLVALFEITPADALPRQGAVVREIDVTNDRPNPSDPGAISAELLRPETTAHAALVRVRLRCFDRTTLVSAAPYHRSIASLDGDAESRLELAGGAEFEDDCWRATRTERDIISTNYAVGHGIELAVDLTPAAPPEAERCAAGGRYRFDDVFDLRSRAVDAWFSIGYDGGA